LDLARPTKIVRLSPALRRALAAFLVIIVAIVAVDAAGPAAMALSLLTTIPVGAYPSWVAINPLTNQLYVTNYNANGSVSVIDGNTNKVVADIPTGSFPRSVAVNPTTNLAYVTNHDSNTLSVINLSTNQVQPNPVSLPLPWLTGVGKRVEQSRKRRDIGHHGSENQP
jgi:YVTN family beta-propeller protein